MASITECPGGVSFLPRPRESREAGHESTADSPWTKPGGVTVCVEERPSSQQGSGLPSPRGQRGNVRPLDPGKRMPSPSSGVAKGTSACVSVCVSLTV